MSITLGTIKGSEIKKNRDSKANSRMISTEISSPIDVQSVELVNGNGEDFNPENNEIVLIIPISDAYKIGLLIDDRIEPDPSVLKGEKEFYSKKNGVKKAKLKLDENGQVILNDGIDFAVKFDKLEAKFNALVAYINGHGHTGVTPGPGATGTVIIPTAINISDAKADKVRL